MDDVDRMDALLALTERQTKAMENLNTYVMRFLAVLAFAALVALVAVLA